MRCVMSLAWPWPSNSPKMATSNSMAAFAQLPSITPVGMASLLPGAGQHLSLRKHDAGLVPMLGEVPVTNVAQRMDMLRKRYGQRFTEMVLHTFLRRKHTVPDTVELLVLRSAEIDSQLENNPETTLGTIHGRSSISALPSTSSNSTDSMRWSLPRIMAFFSMRRRKPGMCACKPQGHWLNVHDRSLLGNGVADSHSFVMPAERGGHSRGVCPVCRATHHGALSRGRAVLSWWRVTARSRRAGAHGASGG